MLAYCRNEHLTKDSRQSLLPNQIIQCMQFAAITSPAGRAGTTTGDQICQEGNTQNYVGRATDPFSQACCVLGPKLEPKWFTFVSLLDHLHHHRKNHAPFHVETASCPIFYTPKWGASFHAPLELYYYKAIIMPPNGPRPAP